MLLPHVRSARMYSQRAVVLCSGAVHGAVQWCLLSIVPIVLHSPPPTPPTHTHTQLAPACVGVLRAPTWRGPYENVISTPIVHPESEDPFVFQTKRGFHLLTNVNTYHRRCASGVACGGHAWSRDGITWSEQTIGAFGPVIKLMNGTTVANSYVERPQVHPLVQYKIQHICWIQRPQVTAPASTRRQYYKPIVTTSAGTSSYARH
jgi:hypothetical protein